VPQAASLGRLETFHSALLGIETLMKIAMNTLLFITYGFIRFIFCLSMLLIKAFNTLN
jgi:hypothetical protein